MTDCESSESFHSSDFVFSGSADDEGGCDVNPKLNKDVELYMDKDNIKIVSAPRTNTSVVSIQIQLKDLGIIDNLVASAWKINPANDIVIEMDFNSGLYDEDVMTPNIHVYQYQHDDDGMTTKTTLTQLNNIFKRFINSFWKFRGTGAEVGGVVKNKILAPIVDYCKNEKVAQTLFDMLIDLCDSVEHCVALSIDFWLTFSSGGIFNLIYKYFVFRLPTLNKHCIACDKIPKLIENEIMNSMLCPFVCGSTLCNFQYTEFGIGIEYTTSIYSSAKIIHLLILMSVHAFRSRRRDIIFMPYPILIDKETREVIVSDTKKDDTVLETIMCRLPLDEIFYNQIDVEKELMTIGIDVINLKNWILSSNRSCIVPIPDYAHIEQFGAIEQYLLVSDSPEKERVFQERRANHGSIYAFHGSPFENWHSILRNGLYNASGTKFQTTGAVYGAGIYISPFFNTAIGYSRFVEGQYNCIALCEIINDHINKPTEGIWTVSDPMNVCTRFLLVFKERRSLPKIEIDSRDEALHATLESVKAMFKE